MKRTLIRSVLPVCLLCLSCGPRPPAEEPEPEPVDEPEPEPVDDGMQIEGLTGSLSQSEVNDTMDMKAIPAWNLCFEYYLAEKEWLFGSITLKFAVAASGKTQSVEILESTYGDYELEQCFKGKAGFLKFPKPHGGPTEVTYTFETDVLDGVSTPATLHGGKFEKVLDPHMDEIEDCLDGSGWQLTFYVGESSSQEIEDENGDFVTVTVSKVLAVGGHGPEGYDRKDIECVEDASGDWKLEMDVDGVRKGSIEL